jgi:hypothetical protein
MASLLRKEDGFVNHHQPTKQRHLLGCGSAGPRKNASFAERKATIQPVNVLRVYLGAVDHVLDVGQTVGEETGWKRFRGMVKRLSTAFALAVPREATKEITPHLAFFQRIAAMIRKRLADDAGQTAGGGGSSDIDAAVRQVIGDAVDAGEVIDLFAAAGLDAARLDILGEDFLNRVSALEQKNLALETLRKLLTDQIKISERTNLVQAQKFREALEKAMLGYTNKQISAAEMIAKLLELAKWVRKVIDWTSSAVRAGSDWSNTFRGPITRPCSMGVRCCLCSGSPRSSARPSGMTCGVNRSPPD